MKRLLALSLLLFSMVQGVSAQATPAYSAEQTTALMPLKYKVNAAQEMAKEGIITSAQAEQATNKYLAEASKVVGRNMTLSEISTVPDPTGSAPAGPLARLAARVAGWFTLVHIVFTLAVFALCFGAIILFKEAIKAIINYFKDIPAIVYEFLGYAGGLALVIGGKHWSVDYGLYFGLAGSIILAASIVGSFVSRSRYTEHITSYVFSFMTAVFAATAMYYQSSLIGVFASIAFMGAWGFSAMMEPMCIAIGFKGKDALARATTVSFFVLTIYVVLQAVNVHPRAMELFYPGLLFMGSFVGYLGLLIASSRWCDEFNIGGYAGRQIITIILGLAALFFGSILGMPILLKVGGTFFAIYLVEKLLDLISALEIRGAVQIGVAAMFIGGVLVGAGMLIVRNIDFLSRYLFFV